MFEKASKLQLRYKVANGVINTEDLWELSLESLDSLAKSLNKELKESSEESFIEEKTKANGILELKFEIVKYIIKFKMERQEKLKLVSEKRQKRKEIMELIAKKENEVLSSKSVEDLYKALEELEESEVQ